MSVLAARSAHAVPITVIGTSDLHGSVERTAVLATRIQLIREELKRAGGGVVYVDGGDLFQGTIESNSVEGKSVIEAYNLLKPDAIAVGNHEFDFGPVGPHATPVTDKEDPRGALKARIAEAHFPFLAANIIDDETGKPLAWKNTKRSHLVTVAGVKIGLIGVASKDTPHTTASANFRGLHMKSLRETVAEEVDALRKQGAMVLVLVAHAGGKCSKVDDPHDTSSCVRDEEIFELAGSLPIGFVDAIVAAHTHQQVAHVVNGMPIIESWANGKGYGRIDLDVNPRTKKVTLVKVHPPQTICEDENAPACVPTPHEGRAVVASATLQRVIQPYLDEAKKQKERKLGVTVTREVKRGYDAESALGNLFADLMLEGAGGADVAIINGGGIRANLPAGELTYGHVFEMMPFDNRYARIRATGADLRSWLEGNFSARKGGIFSIGGVRAEVSCEGKKARVTLSRMDGRPVADTEKLVIVTTDFLATGNEVQKLPPGSVTFDDGDNIRESLVKALERRTGKIDGEGTALLDPARRRIQPGRCKANDYSGGHLR